MSKRRRYHEHDGHCMHVNCKYMKHHVRDDLTMSIEGMATKNIIMGISDSHTGRSTTQYAAGELALSWLISQTCSIRHRCIPPRRSLSKQRNLFEGTSAVTTVVLNPCSDSSSGPECRGYLPPHRIEIRARKTCFSLQPSSSSTPGPVPKMGRSAKFHKRQVWWISHTHVHF